MRLTLVVSLICTNGRCSYVPSLFLAYASVTSCILCGDVETSNRASTNDRAKVRHKVKETRKKKARAAKKNPQWKSRESSLFLFSL